MTWLLDHRNVRRSVGTAEGSLHNKALLPYSFLSDRKKLEIAFPLLVAPRVRHRESIAGDTCQMAQYGLSSWLESGLGDSVGQDKECKQNILSYCEIAI